MLLESGSSSSIDDLLLATLTSSTYLDDDNRDDDATTIYSYCSTWSSNYTRSNLTGPGRNLGNLYSWMGSRLEQRLAKRVERSEARKYEEAVTVLRSKWRWIDVMFWSRDPKEHEKACTILLRCASIQVKAFETIIEHYVSRPSKVLSAFSRVFERRKQKFDDAVSSWRRPSVHYTFGWLYWYKQASLCLSSHRTMFLEAVADLDNVILPSKNFLRFEGLLKACSNVAEVHLAVRCTASYWNGNGVEDYILKKGFNDSALLTLTNGLIDYWELAIYRMVDLQSTWEHFIVSSNFVDGILASLQSVPLDKISNRRGHNALPKVLKSVFKLHYFLHSSRCGSLYYDSHGIFGRFWGALCHKYLANPKLAEIHRDMLRLEQKYARAMRRRFPWEKDSPMDNDEKARVGLSVYNAVSDSDSDSD
ncbi:hypothetical protein SCHPADRAFT_966073 [Schizopora paradoxa]|uniref:Uncharacterized protein n=1 Tax=Schizopora paradoxa TaxID=27342 RepID=A0A0H2RRS4_9AGAM|nr:hypothetical protein SCHPADRAFT_966073 [Schizopora paradoxa]